MKLKNIFNYSLIISLFTVTIFSKNVYSQCIIPNEFEGNTGANMTLLFQLSFINSLNIQSNDAYVVATNQNGLVVGSTPVYDSQTSIAIWGNDTFSSEIDGAFEGDTIILSLVDGISLINVFPLTVNNAILEISYVTNGFLPLNNASTQLSCIYDPNSGCTDNIACNYNSISLSDDGSCIYLEGECDECIDGVILDNDIDNDGICDLDEIAGCMDESACNFNPLATDPPIDVNLGTGTFWIYTDSVFIDNNWLMTDSIEFVPINPMDCNYEDSDNDGICDIFEIVGCSDSNACNYNEFSTDTDNLLCLFGTGCDTCSGESDGTGTILDNDLDDDGVCDFDEIIGCTDPQACNYDATPTTDTDNSLCNYSTDIDECATCSGEIDGTGTVVDNDIDNDGVCNQDEVEGCITISACNYNDLATEDDGSCVYAEAQYNCDGECLFDFDNDGVCDLYEVLGCTDSDYLEYDELATEENGSCQTLIVLGCLDDSYLEYNFNANVNDSSLCVTPIVLGCIDSLACNYDSEANTSDDSCEIIDGICETCEDGLIVDNDLDDDGVCDFDEIIGCTDPQACNYDATPTTDTDNSLCNYSTDLDECATCSGEIDGTGTIVDNDIDNDGVCNSDEIVGCTDTLACNYDAASTTDTDNSLCNYSTDIDECASCSGEIDGTGIIIDNDFDDDGVCDDIDFDDGIGLNELVIAPIYLYPNPSKDFINLDFESNLNSVSIEILNSLGDLFIQENISDISSKQIIQIAVHNLPSGIYLLRVKSDHQLHRINWIKN